MDDDPLYYEFFCYRKCTSCSKRWTMKKSEVLHLGPEPWHRFILADLGWCHKTLRHGIVILESLEGIGMAMIRGETAIGESRDVQDLVHRILGGLLARMENVNDLQGIGGIGQRSADASVHQEDAMIGQAAPSLDGQHARKVEKDAQVRLMKRINNEKLLESNARPVQMISKITGRGIG